LPYWVLISIPIRRPTRYKQAAKDKQFDKAEEHMWKRDESVRSTSVDSTVAPRTPAPPTAETSGPRPDMRHNIAKDIVNIGKSVVIKGELNGHEDLTVEGQIEGTIQLPEHVLTVGSSGRIKAQVFAKGVIVIGEVTGNVTATDNIDIRDNGSVDGDIVASRVAIADGAHFHGSVDMQGKRRDAKRSPAS
jgi:cytoskeletal protein CcmA (bactofilin family)